MESHRTPSGRRILLPAEVQLCNVVGITEEEYWYFVGLIESYNGKRPPAYDLVPDIVNMPPVAIGAMSFMGVQIGFWGVVAIGAALTAVSAMLAPKPRAPKFDTPETLKTADAQGAKRFAPQSSFNSVQDLATLGEIIPLVFANRGVNPEGGVRVGSKLLWSQMRSLFTGQQLRGLFLFSSGQLGAMPDYEGFAIGDSLLANYTDAKVALYFMTDGGRPQEFTATGGTGNTNERYNKGTLDNWEVNDAFSVWWDRTNEYNSNIFSGTRTPGSQTQFGAFAPFPNASRFRVPYELVLKPKDSKNKEDIGRKRLKIQRSFARFSSVKAARDASGNPITTTVESYRRMATKGYEMDYLINNSDPTEYYSITNNEGERESEYKPWGTDDVKSSVDSTRVTSDSGLSKGDIYLVGNVLTTCKRISYDGDQGIWTPLNKAVVTATFEAIEDDIYAEFDIKQADWDADPVYRNLVVQRCAIGTVSNNRVCEVTEIGLKSTVWKQISGFANVNSHPGEIELNPNGDTPEEGYNTTTGTVYQYEQDNGNIQLGAMSKYIKRLSFFRLQARKAGEETWTYIDGGKPFVVRGNTPQPQYNFIRIVHTTASQCEFRFLPYPGNLALSNYEGRDVHIFTKPAVNQPYGNVQLNSGDYDVYYSGKLTRLNGALMSNAEWYLGDLPDLYGSEVVGLSKTVQGNIPTHKDWVKVVDDAYDEKGSTRVRYQVRHVGRNPARGHLDFDYPGTQYMTESRLLSKPRYGARPDEELFPRTENCSHLIDGSEHWKPWYVHTRNPEVQFRVGSLVKYQDGYYIFKIHKYTMQDIKTADRIINDRDNVATTTNSNGSGLTLKVIVYNNNGTDAIEWSIDNPGSGYNTGDRITFNYIGIEGNELSISCIVETASNILVEEDSWPKGPNLNPYDAVADYYQYDAEQSSHLNGPEHEIIYVNEQKYNSGGAMNYDNLGLAGLRLDSAKEWSSFSQLSSYIKKGVKVEKLINDKGLPPTLPSACTTDPITNQSVAPRYGVDCEGRGSTNLLPEIAYALLTDNEIGAGELIGVTSVDKEKMTIAARFCLENGFFWDGVITQSQNLREFIFTQAAYCFLDFTIIGGRFSLYPSVPFNETDYMIDPNVKPEIKALFTDGNIKDLKVSFLSPEERQVFKARVLWRKEEENGFPETKSVEVRLDDVQSDETWQVGSENDPIETFDMSIFCASNKHAIRFAKYALRTRQLVDHGLTFQTTPQAAMFLNPGDYFRLYSESTHTSRFSNGVITEGGVIQSQTVISNGQNIYYWNPKSEELRDKVEYGSIVILDSGLAADVFRGCVFTIAQTNSSDRVYKVESLTFAEDGLVEVAGSHVPLTKNGYVAALHQVYDGEEDFVIRT